MNRGVKISIGVVVVLLFMAGAVYGWRAYANGRKLDELQAKAMELSQRRSTGNDGNREQWEARRELRKEVETLPESYQQQFRQSIGNMRRSREEQRYDDYFKLTKLERRKQLDKEITEGEKRRKEWDARRKQFEAERAKNVSTNGNAGGPAGGPPNGGRGGPGGWQGGRGMSARLDNTTPELRAKRAQYMRDMEQRRKERGLPADPRRR